MPETLTLDEVLARSWSLHRPDGACRSPLVMLGSQGAVVGYEHPNETSWMPYAGGFAFVSNEGKITSVAQEVLRQPSVAVQIRMVSPDNPDLVKHILVEVPRQGTDDGGSGRQDRPVATEAVDAGRLSPTDTRGEMPMNSASSFLDPDIRRVFFIANNGNIVEGVFDSWGLGSNDVVVQYNKPLFFHALAATRCHKVHFFSPNSKSCWGFTDDAKPEVEYHAQEYCSLTFALAHWIPTSVRHYFESLQGAARRFAIVPDRDIALHCYPQGRSPSAGFISVAFFRSLNWLRRQQSRKPLSLFMVGFTGAYAPGKAWPGHDFEYEQAAYQTWLDLRRLHIDGSAVTRVQPKITP